MAVQFFSYSTHFPTGQPHCCAHSLGLPPARPESHASWGYFAFLSWLQQASTPVSGFKNFALLSQRRSLRFATFLFHIFWRSSFTTMLQLDNSPPSHGCPWRWPRATLFGQDSRQCAVSE